MRHHIRAFFAVATFVIGLIDPAVAGTRPVVLELFTSEGCSSCPPAEVIVNELAQRRDVLPLSFHVDYWDDLGWKDRYSLAIATQRQREYARTLHQSSVYTPQAVIDGSRDVVGSRRSAVMDAIAGRREGVPTAVSVSGGTVRVSVGAAPEAASADVILIGYLREATTPIAAGENTGHTLKESNVVLVLHDIGRWDGRPRDFQLPLSSLPANVTDVAVLVQAAGQGAILGAVAQSMR